MLVVLLVKLIYQHLKTNLITNLKTNLKANLKTKVDKIDVDKLKTVPDDLAKLSNVVKNEVVKKTDFSADDYVKKTKFSGDINSLDDEIDKVEKKIPDVSSLETKRNVTTLVKNLDNRIDDLKIKEYAKKTTLSNYMLTSDFNTKSTELENKIKDADSSSILGGSDTVYKKYFPTPSKPKKSTQPNSGSILIQSRDIDKIPA